MREVLKGFPRLAEDILRRVPIEETLGDIWELYGISEAGDKAIDSVALGQFSEDQL
jgi:acyl-CoA synthetase (AMP-forming)/AMP-acid ligase II